jgi:hypothetical protein
MAKKGYMGNRDAAMARAFGRQAEAAKKQAEIRRPAPIRDNPTPVPRPTLPEEASPRAGDSVSRPRPLESAPLGASLGVRDTPVVTEPAPSAVRTIVPDAPAPAARQSAEGQRSSQEALAAKNPQEAATKQANERNPLAANPAQPGISPATPSIRSESNLAAKVRDVPGQISSEVPSATKMYAPAAPRVRDVAKVVSASPAGNQFLSHDQFNNMANPLKRG